MNRNDLARLIRALLDLIKTAAGCAICGYAADPRGLAFDHITPADKHRTASGKPVHIADMAKGARYSLRTILAEIDKCRVLCHTCHAIHTHRVQRASELFACIGCREPESLAWYAASSVSTPPCGICGEHGLYPIEDYARKVGINDAMRDALALEQPEDHSPRGFYSWESRAARIHAAIASGVSVDDALRDEMKR